ncbi:MAG: acyl-CoA synthetase FdrA [Candidatus Hadarchaeum sp.]|uniref:acyl-CoA synthetase FdrA n=1 Tax=Candidatus Hadarchaeum sp. TaxID=2883567 RepID=UPI003D13550B
MVELAVITASGLQALKESQEAIRAGKSVVLLGGGLSLTEELDLKAAAAERGLLFLGPSCGTSILNGEGFGIWNKVRNGPIGIVGTFGSGIQQIVSLVDNAGVSQALCVGNRDLSQRINALGTLSALKFLEEDPSTEVIVLVSREPVTSVQRRVLDAAVATGKPTVVCFLGGKMTTTQSGLMFADTLAEAAWQARALAGKAKPGDSPAKMSEEYRKIAEAEHSGFGYGQKFIRGLYSGGALCTEAMLIIRRYYATVYSNIPLEPKLRLPDPYSSKGHAFVDFGAEPLFIGSHPAVDLAPRCERLLKEARDWETAVVLFDVLLGVGAHPDPAGDLVPVVNQAKGIVEESGGYLSAVACVIGTKQDPQGFEKQVRQLERAGVLVMGSNAQAAKMAALIASGGKIWKDLAR